MTNDELNSIQKLGRNIAKKRSALKMSQDFLAAEAEISNRTLQKLELGQTDPRFSTLEKLALRLGVKVKDFLE